MRSILGIFCAVLLATACARADSIFTTSVSVTFIVPTQSKIDLSSDTNYNISDSLSDATGSANGNIFTSHAGTQGIYSFTGDSSVNVTVEFASNFQTGERSSFINAGFFSASAGGTTGNVTINEIDGASTAPLYSYSFSSASASFLISYLPVEISADKTYEIDYQIFHTGAGSGSASLGIYIAPIPTTLCGALALITFIGYLECRKRRLNSRSAP